MCPKFFLFRISVFVTMWREPLLIPRDKLFSGCARAPVVALPAPNFVTANRYT